MIEMTFGQLSDNFGAIFVSIWMKFTVTVNFLLLVLECLKFNCFMLQSPKIKCYRSTPFKPSYFSYVVLLRNHREA